MRRVMFALLTVLPLLGASAVAAQEPWSVEVRGGSAFATQELGDADLGAGFGFEATAGYRFMPHLSAYVGWDWVHFAIDAEEGAGGDVEETGYAFGLRFEHPLAAALPVVRVRAGGTYDHIEFESEDGEITADSDHGFGWDAGVSLVIPIRHAWEVTPGARYRALSRDLEIGGVESEVELTYVMVELGFKRVF